MFTLFRGMSAKDTLQYVERRRLRWNAKSESRGRTETKTAEEQLLHLRRSKNATLSGKNEPPTTWAKNSGQIA